LIIASIPISLIPFFVEISLKKEFENSKKPYISPTGTATFSPSSYLPHSTLHDVYDLSHLKPFLQPYFYIGEKPFPGSLKIPRGFKIAFGFNPNYASGFILMPFCNDSDTSCIIWV
jgi:hypothetical protein